MAHRLVDVRLPRAADASALGAMWRRSIEGLCSADHGGDPALIAAWTANKTKGHLATAFADQTLSWVLACDPQTGDILGVALLGPGGTVMALYVDPTAVRCGVGSRLLRAVEEEAAEHGITRLSLESTATARPFYAARGFRDSGPPIAVFAGLRAWPMDKELGEGSSEAVSS
ncbi:GNAT family N-acetyltransferase [Rhodospira trueperi]|uniref:Acetyltransferase (GNAT) domain-containing protein n=1 Tax=Rhodospira trueperi TaxID=69960 RepID=A0A1G7EIK9_9PROT|nr:GNAT family N-acetyltransferase [Rhodospira trueperi]SDE63478.1 Acetyltransferase (GNAT) domain-containing protein [Rhodospira trueperi]